ncbi:fungal-specific transcription factor domain-containing protein [Cristinia sonorae]|uniref:Fungal-specific transcription factor domain-containing protein n=1 Tax=Cristinia sonorae TaxID=1940300 RepID=A0A8K0XKP5_9AGAR|nr:fungal-specific transcription factor domain-containing protein [Cristinia sonorae]
MTFSDNYTNSRHPRFEQAPKPPYSQPQPLPSSYVSQPPILKSENREDCDLRATESLSPPSLGQFSRKSSAPLYRFGDSGDVTPSPDTTVSSFSFMTSHGWPHPSSGSSSGYQHQQHHYANDPMHGYAVPTVSSQAHPQAQISMTDKYDDGDDDGLSDLPTVDGMSAGMGVYGAFGSAEESGKGDKLVRRRSSKACDRCRKSKCKCERTSLQEPCKNCILLGTACTFLGPSRKRGPPKGYIDAIEARLHQTEALIGILLSSKDSRAKTLLDDLREDTLAKEIISRVDNGTYGHQGRLHASQPSTAARPRPPQNEAKDSETPNLTATHPSVEWQETVISKLNSIAIQRNTLVSDDQAMRESASSASASVGRNGASAKTKTTMQTPSETSTTDTRSRTHSEEREKPRARRPTLSLQPTPSNPTPLIVPSHLTSTTTGTDRSDSDQNTSTRRQRRRVEQSQREPGQDSRTQPNPPSPASTTGNSRSPVQSVPLHPVLLNKKASTISFRALNNSRSPDDADEDADVESNAGDRTGSGEDELAVAVGQLSINEDEQVRYHGKASGLHLLGAGERDDDRVEGGIWRFPGARVWPPLPATARKLTKTRTEHDWQGYLPEPSEQEYLLQIYWAHVHPALPIIQKKLFMESFQETDTHAEGINAPDSPHSGVSSTSSGKRQRIPAILLLAMFSIAARYCYATSNEFPLPGSDSMWAAGDSYLESAKKILDSTYAHSRPSTCQALLLMGYREVGIGAMAQAWLYIGMAIRMAQDLGMHKNADKWVNIGKALFTSDELQERRRIWYGCIVMDKYVSSYIGRPVAIFENDFDTELPNVDPSDEYEAWSPHPSMPMIEDPLEPHPDINYAMSSHITSCFNEFAKLSIILSMIVQTVYSIRRPNSRSSEHSRLEQLLDKWYYELPEHLRFDPASQKDSELPPHVLTLHMHYWCSVLLLHRPFARHASEIGDKLLNKEHPVGDASRKAYDLCRQAANHISSIVHVYTVRQCPKRGSVFLSYYVFTAAIMHVATLKAFPMDPQASLGLSRCYDILRRMQYIWPSAWRAYQLLQGAKVSPSGVRTSPAVTDKRKRDADIVVDQEQQHSPVHETLYRGPHAHSRVPSSGNPSRLGYSMSIDIQHAETPTFFPPFDSWAPEGEPMHSYPAHNLSTSVLPQQFSTGFVDERSHRQSERSTQRFPQYWNDYSTLGQMGPPYPVPSNDMLPPASGSSPSPRSSQPNVGYSQDQYMVFNNLPPSGQS